MAVEAAGAAFAPLRTHRPGRTLKTFAVSAREPAGELLLQVVRRPAGERGTTRYAP
jgi:hypothetical protein